MNCHKYNDKKLDRCSDCGFILDPTIIEVEDHLTHQIEELITESINQKQFVNCPRCGNPVDLDIGVCDVCNKPISRHTIDHQETQHQNEQMKPTFLILSAPLNLKLSLEPYFQKVGRYYQNLEQFPTISRDHFSYRLQEDQVFIQDHSTHGTKINGSKLIQGTLYQIRDKDILTLANIDCLVSIHAD
jgi:ribosomal protein L37E